MIKLTRRFAVTFKDSEVLEFYDILKLEDKQINEVLEIAAEYTKKHLRKNEDKGNDLTYLTTPQIRRVLTSKNRLVFGRTSDELRKQKKIVFTLHSQERILERIGSNKLEIILEIVQKIIDADKVLKAQYKGYSSLSYTLAKDKDPEHFKLPISFKWVKRKRQISLVTVAYRGAPPSEMTSKIVNDDKQADKMAEYRKKLVERSKKNKGHK